jgi:hypothetical protein
MTTLVSDQLVTSLSQSITVYRDQVLAGMKARLYFHNSPIGVFYFNIYKNGDVVDSISFDSVYCKDQIGTSDDYFWIDLAIKRTIGISKGDIVLKLESSGYTFNTNSWIGWCKDFKNPTGEVIGSPIDFTEHPYMFKLVEYKEREL